MTGTQSTFDAVVIGAGVIGSSIAYALTKAGYRVAVVERNTGPGQGSTSSSSAIIRFNYSTLPGVLTSWEAHYSWLGWEEFLGGTDDDGRLARFHRTGQVCLDSPAQDPSKVFALFDQVGVPYQVWSADDLRSKLPWLDPAKHWPPKPVTDEAFFDDPVGEVGAYYCPDAGFMDDPSFAAHNLATAATRAGATFIFRANVVAIPSTGGRVTGVELGDGTAISAPIVVNVSGPVSGKINALAGVGAQFVRSTRPMRAEVDSLMPPGGYNSGDGSALQPGPILSDLDLGTYFRGAPSGEIYLGGAEPECDPLEWIDDADDFNTSVTGEIWERQTLRAARRMPDLAVPNRPRGIAAAYDVASDWIPIYDRTELDGFYIAIGTSGNQFKNAPLVGSYLTEIITACENGRDHDTDPVQLALPHTGLTVDLGHYSRRRGPDPASSNTVMG